MASPTQWMCLSELRELVMDREAGRAVIHGVTKSWTRLGDWTELNWKIWKACSFFQYFLFFSLDDFCWSIFIFPCYLSIFCHLAHLVNSKKTWILYFSLLKFPVGFFCLFAFFSFLYWLFLYWGSLSIHFKCVFLMEHCYNSYLKVSDSFNI